MWGGGTRSISISEARLGFAVITDQHKFNTIKAHSSLTSEVRFGSPPGWFLSQVQTWRSSVMFYGLRVLHLQCTNGGETLLNYPFSFFFLLNKYFQNSTRPGDGEGIRLSIVSSRKLSDYCFQVP